jgi:hypothetical protein
MCSSCGGGRARTVQQYQVRLADGTVQGQTYASRAAAAIAASRIPGATAVPAAEAATSKASTS